MVLSASVVAADVTVGGSGRMGIIYFDDEVQNAYGKDTNWNFTSRIRIEFTATGETDGGLAFGGSIRADNSSGGNVGTDGNVFISGEYGKLAMGDVSGGAEVVNGDLAFVSLTGLGDQNEFIYLGNDGVTRPNAQYTYSNQGLTLALGLSDEEAYSAGVGYDGGIWQVGLGYEKMPKGGSVGIEVDGETLEAFQDIQSDVHQLIGGAAVTFSGVTLKGMWGQFDINQAGVDVVNQYGVSAEGTFGAITVAAYYRELEGLKGAVVGDPANGNTVGDNNIALYGIGAEYDLGGGASVAGGVANTFGDNTVADLGVKFAF
jgi:outer membrane protein OmpU